MKKILLYEFRRGTFGEFILKGFFFFLFGQPSKVL